MTDVSCQCLDAQSIIKKKKKNADDVCYTVSIISSPHSSRSGGREQHEHLVRHWQLQIRAETMAK